MYRLNLRRFYKAMGWPGGKIPAEVQGSFTVDFPNDAIESTVRLQVSIHPSVSNGKDRFAFKHRVFVSCPGCGASVPAGRLHQHYGTGTCTNPCTQCGKPTLSTADVCLDCATLLNRVQ